MESIASKFKSREYAFSEGKGWSMRSVWVVSGWESTTERQFEVGRRNLTAMFTQLDLQASGQTGGTN